MQTYSIDVSYEQEEYAEQAKQDVVIERLQEILSALGSESCEFSVSFVSDSTIQEMNKNYRGKDEPTDILTFVQDDSVEDFSWPELNYDELETQPEEIPVLGDVVISLEALKRNALSFSVEPDEELFRLLIHGVLHLFGEDHATNDADEPMLVQQEELLARLRGSKR